jgi:hypothetical protein
MSDPYQVVNTKTTPFPNYFIDGEPFTFTISVSEKSHYQCFHECFLIYRVNDDVNENFVYQSKWTMTSCTKQPWSDDAQNPTQIEVVLLATSPFAERSGSLLGLILLLLPSRWRSNLRKRLRRKRFPGGPGNGNVYGSNDQSGVQRHPLGAANPYPHVEDETWFLVEANSNNRDFEIYES